MFKKQKKSNNPTPPSAPSLEEVLSDIDTFQVDIELHTNKNMVDLLNSSTEDWWEMFEHSMQDLKCLEMVNNEIEGAKNKLKSLKLEIDTKSLHLRNEIEQQQLIDEALE